jgi:RNA polymerase primary sigma factor
VKVIKKINGELLSEEECYRKHKRLIPLALRTSLPVARNAGLDPDDLISEGNIALIKSYRNFDDSKGYKFSTYAVKNIRLQGLKFLRDHSKTVKHPRRALELANKINSADYEELSKKEIAEKLNVSVKNVQLAFSSMMQEESLQKVVSDENEKMTLLDQMGMRADYTEVYVNDFIASLEPIEQNIVKMRLEDNTQSEIGRKMGYTQPHIGRLNKRIGEKYLKYVM